MTLTSLMTTATVGHSLVLHCASAVRQLSQKAVRASLAGLPSPLSNSLIWKSHKIGLLPRILHEATQDLAANRINVSKL